MDFNNKSLYLRSQIHKIMYAIVEIAGQQFKAEAGKKLYVHRLEGNEGDAVSFDRVLLTEADGAIKVGTPVVAGVKVNAKIVAHLKDDKVTIYKRREERPTKKHRATASR